MDFVLDASVALSWCFPDESNEYADRILLRLKSETAITPPIWPVEISNALLVGMRRGRMTAEQVRETFELLSKLRIQPQFGLSIQEMRLVTSLAIKTGLSAYDATYLELAQRYSIPIATADAKLQSAAVSKGISLV